MKTSKKIFSYIWSFSRLRLLNYNESLYDLLEIFWGGAGIGVNPLGADRSHAKFHILPLYAKVKLLHFLCELRLDRPDVEALTKVVFYF